jgi:putative DNA-invertase from lambdoid prophage Rac
MSSVVARDAFVPDDLIEFEASFFGLGSLVLHGLLCGADARIEDGGHFGALSESVGRRLFDLLRNGDTLVVRWVDRLGRNYQDICDTIRVFMRRGIVIRTVINGITFDGATKDAMQCAIRDALIAFMAATAQAQAEATKEAQRAGIAHAKANGHVRAYKGRKPSYSRKQFENAQAMLGKSASVGEVAGSTGLTRQKFRCR